MSMRMKWLRALLKDLLRIVLCFLQMSLVFWIPKEKTISLITLDEGKKLIKEKIITGGMIPKCESAFEALKKGVKQIWILEGRLPLKKSKGTLIVKKFSNHFKQPFLEIK